MPFMTDTTIDTVTETKVHEVLAEVEKSNTLRVVRLWFQEPGGKPREAGILTVTAGVWERIKAGLAGRFKYDEEVITSESESAS